ncbi:MAG: heparan-alpha-glucosaminide N-acetyltransferase domain-containing protein [Atopobiaceae bacterium]|nr:heparan-alpha-glucosaminide N-acetyltransferase domain-containing protein [Atopobiaceae bacterium]MDD2587342.1 heparan-alpha-glucosaminide N-acetyltransferase domain-containing protein [Atopobiaceae bacterium]MDD4381475.1 heparan-alpha-glucosaminide N-acetyltransferase domain-containing protein [Atopobiaceae bacterium]
MSRRSSGRCPETGHPARLRGFDVLRGIACLSMVGFHLCYDLTALKGMVLWFFVPPFEDIWRASISWTFLLLAGCMCALSRSNLRRSVVYLAVAALITLVTTLAGVDLPITFGIIFCMGASTLVAWALERFGVAPHGPVAAMVLASLFVLCLEVPSGRVGLGPLSIALPHSMYGTDWLSWLGLPGPTFSSGDYYPLLPYCLLYLCGSALGSWWSARGWPRFCSSLHARPLEFVGRHSLALYVLHQPLLLVLLGLL